MLCCLYFLTIMNNATIILCVQGFVWAHIFISFWYMSTGRLTCWLIWSHDMTFGGTRCPVLTCFCPLWLEGRKGRVSCYRVATGGSWPCPAWLCSSSSGPCDLVFQRLTTLPGLWPCPELGSFLFLTSLEGCLWNTTSCSAWWAVSPYLQGTQLP